MGDREVDPRVVAGLNRQLERWREQLDSGADRLGWKIGLNSPEVQDRLGLREPVIGFLTDATALDPGASHSLAGAANPLVEPEVAIELRRDVEPGAPVDAVLGAIESLAPAIEVVDIPAPPDDIEEVLAGNVFHRAVAIAPSRQDAAVAGIRASVSIDGHQREAEPVRTDLAETIGLVADLLGAAGERLSAGDRIIAGALTRPVAVAPGNRVEADLGPLGRVELRFEG
jgi:2-keto-4-pentenoate hydratase